MKTVTPPPAADSQEALLSHSPCAQSFPGTRLLFISSSNELHARLLPVLRGWGLEVQAYANPSAIRIGDINDFQIAIFGGVRHTWKPRSENRVAAALDFIIECDMDYAPAPERINQRIITVSSRSLPGIFLALQWAINFPHSASPPHSSDSQSPDAHLQHLHDISPTVKAAFLASLSSSLHLIRTSGECNVIQRELHNLSGSLRFLHLKDMSSYCASLEESIAHNGLAAHAMDIARLQSEIVKLKHIMLAMNAT